MLFKRVHLWSIAAMWCVWLIGFCAVGCKATSGTSLRWLTNYDVARAEARSKGKPLMIDFSATWCEPCHELEMEVFNSPDVRARLNRDVVLLKLDFDELGAHDTTLLARFKVSGLPRVAFEDSQGRFIESASFEGKISRQEFLRKLNEL